jgi:uncharacterized protein
MLRLVVLVALVVLAVWLIRRALARSNAKPRPQEPLAGKAGELVKCAHCGVHLPRAEARQTQGLLYCSEEHARLGRR